MQLTQCDAFPDLEQIHYPDMWQPYETKLQDELVKLKDGIRSVRRRMKVLKQAKQQQAQIDAMLNYIKGV